MSGVPPEHHQQQPCLDWPDCDCGDGSICAMLRTGQSPPHLGASPDGDGAHSEFCENIDSPEDAPAAILTVGEFEEHHHPQEFLGSTIVVIEVRREF